MVHFRTCYLIISRGILSCMAQGAHKRKSAGPELASKQQEHVGDKKVVELGVAANENDGGEKKFLNDFPHFTAHRGDVRALSAFRRKFKLNRYDDLDIFVVMGHDDSDVSAERVFESDDTENNVVFFTKNGGRMRSL